MKPVYHNQLPAKKGYLPTIYEKGGEKKTYEDVSGYHVMEQGFLYMTYFGKNDKEEKNLLERTRKSVYLSLSSIDRMDVTKLIRVIGKRDVFEYKRQGSPA